MRFRRRGRAGFSRRAKTPTIWQRTITTALSTGAGGAAAGIELVDPDFLYSNSQLSTDQRWTLRRLILNLEYRVTTAYSAATRSLAALGILCTDDSLTVAQSGNPFLVGAQDQRADWMYLATGILDTAAAVDSTLAFSSPDTMRHIDIRTARKCTSNSSPVLVLGTLDMTTRALTAAGVLLVVGQVSALWSQTRR